MRRFGVVALMVFAALTVGGIGAATGSWLGWQQVAPTPTAAETRVLLRTAMPDTVDWNVGWHDDVHDVHGISAPDSGDVPGQQQADASGSTATRPAFDAAGARLRAAGWRIGHRTGNFFVASRGDLVMEWEFFPKGTYETPAEDSVEVWLWHFTPLRVLVSTGLGWVLGAALGWVLAGVVRRMPHGATSRRLALNVGCLLMLVLAFSTLAAVWFTGIDLLRLPIRGGQPVAVWIGYFPFLMPFGFQMG